MPQLAFEDFAPQLIWLAILFTVLYLIMSRIALPRIANVLEERRDRIASDLDKAEQLKKRTEEAIAAYEQAIAEARANAHAIGQEARDKLSAEIEEERSQVEAQIAEQTANAEARIQAAKTAAMSHVNEVAVDAATEIVKQLIGGRVAKTEISDAVGKALSS